MRSYLEALPKNLLNMKSKALTTAALAMVMAGSTALAADTLDLPGKEGPGKGKKNRPDLRR
jgi:hypothetical protein